MLRYEKGFDLNGFDKTLAALRLGGAGGLAGSLN